VSPQLDERFYDSYLSSHAGLASRTASALIYTRDIKPHLAARPVRPRVLDIGCGQGQLVDLMARDGFDAHGIDRSPEQVQAAREAGISTIALGDFHENLREHPGAWDAIIATDLLEHLKKAELVATFDEVRGALRPGGLFIARVPNAVSPLGGNIMYGDLTHETWFTRHVVSQLAAVTGFKVVRILSCPPVAGTLKGLIRTALWRPISGILKTMLAVETGQLRGHIVTQNLTFVASPDLHRP
jgi:2-polyprenyl-3-methyl-5-hydroxy-6-metoxy-1,4-benzoquinol methylase